MAKDNNDSFVDETKILPSIEVEDIEHSEQYLNHLEETESLQSIKIEDIEYSELYLNHLEKTQKLEPPFDNQILTEKIDPVLESSLLEESKQKECEKRTIQNKNNLDSSKPISALGSSPINSDRANSNIKRNRKDLPNNEYATKKQRSL